MGIGADYFGTLIINRLSCFSKRRRCFTVYLHNLLKTNLLNMMQKDELVEVLPQLLGIIFALVLLGTFTSHSFLLYGALLLLLSLILRLRFLLTLARVLHSIISQSARLLTYALLVFSYICIITPYALVYRIFNRKATAKFTLPSPDGTFYIDSTHTYNKEYFEHPW